MSEFLSYLIQLPNGEKLEVTHGPLPKVGSALQIRKQFYLVSDVRIDYVEDDACRENESIFFGSYVVELK